MYDQRMYKGLWNKRDRYALTPPRYSQVASIASVRKLFKEKGRLWKTHRRSIDYVDLGCGNCRGTPEFASFLEKTIGMPVNTTGIDASQHCEISCKERNIQFYCLDLNSDPIPLQDCEVVTLFETIEHVFNTDHLVQSIRDSISDDGVLLVTTLNVVCWKNRILVPLGIQPFNTEVSTKKLSYGWRLKALKTRIDSWKPAGHIRPFTLHSLRDMLEDNGFTVISSHGLENWKPLKFLEYLAKNMCTGILVIARPS